MLHNPQCNAVLDLDANNVKALYRRGQCNLIINEIEDALADFLKVNTLICFNRSVSYEVAYPYRSLNWSQATRLPPIMLQSASRRSR